MSGHAALEIRLGLQRAGVPEGISMGNPTGLWGHVMRHLAASAMRAGVAEEISTSLLGLPPESLEATGHVGGMRVGRVCDGVSLELEAGTLALSDG